MNPKLQRLTHALGLGNAGRSDRPPGGPRCPECGGEPVDRERRLAEHGGRWVCGQGHRWQIEGSER